MKIARKSWSMKTTWNRSRPHENLLIGKHFTHAHGINFMGVLLRTWIFMNITDAWKDTMKKIHATFIALNILFNSNKAAALQNYNQELWHEASWGETYIYYLTYRIKFMVGIYCLFLLAVINFCLSGTGSKIFNLYCHSQWMSPCLHRKGSMSLR